MLGNNKKSIGFNSSFYNASGGQSIDPDAAAFIIAAGITNPVQINAINYLTLSLKGINTTENPTGVNFFSGAYCIYPFVGGTATQHRYNLRDVSTFLITFFGSVTHDNNGITGNGVNGYGDTFFSPFNNSLPLNDCGIGVYSRTNSNIGTDIGSGDIGLTNALYIQSRASGASVLQANSTTFAAVSQSDSRGLFIGVRRNSTSMQIYKNGSSIILKTSSADSSSTTVNNLNLLRLNVSGGIQYSNKNLAFSIIFTVTGSSYSNTNMVSLYNIVQQYQTLLSREV